MSKFVGGDKVIIANLLGVNDEEMTALAGSIGMVQRVYPNGVDYIIEFPSGAIVRFHESELEPAPESAPLFIDARDETAKLQARIATLEREVMTAVSSSGVNFSMWQASQERVKALEAALRRITGRAESRDIATPDQLFGLLAEIEIIATGGDLPVEHLDME